jgi:hypothetical protein
LVLRSQELAHGEIGLGIGAVLVSGCLLISV